MNKGFGTLFIVIILGGVSLSLALWVYTSGLWSIRGSIDNTTSAQSKALANACAEIALYRLRENQNFVGVDIVVIEQSQCQYTVTDLGGINRNIQITSTIKNITRNLEIETEGFNPIQIKSWNENL